VAVVLGPVLGRARINRHAADGIDGAFGGLLVMVM
jgi:hypothetical protein